MACASIVALAGMVTLPTGPSRRTHSGASPSSSSNASRCDIARLLCECQTHDDSVLALALGCWIVVAATPDRNESEPLVQPDRALVRRPDLEQHAEQFFGARDPHCFV